MKIILDFDNTMGLPKHEIDDGLTLLYLLGVKILKFLGSQPPLAMDRWKK